MKKIINIFLVLSLMLVLSACSSNKKNDSLSEQRINDIAQEAQDSAEASKDHPTSTKEECMTGCKIMWKSNSGNKDKSDSQMDIDCNSLCDAGQGMQNQDVDSCAKAQGILKDTCYSDIATKSNNPALCEKIESKMFVNTCYVAIVEKTKDKTLCEKVTEKFMKEVCLEK